MVDKVVGDIADVALLIVLDGDGVEEVVLGQNVQTTQDLITLSSREDVDTLEEQD